jgi:hypothetical protein
LSSAAFDTDDFSSARAAITLGLLDPASDYRACGAPAEDAQLIESSSDGRLLRYLAPVPGSELALVTEFSLEGGLSIEITARVDALMASFRWADVAVTN